MNDQQRYRRARARVQQLRFFYVHVAVYVCVNIFLLLINLLTSPFSLWFYWPLLGWGIGLAVHAFFVYGIMGAGGIMGREWEEQEIRKMMEQESISDHTPIGMRSREVGVEPATSLCSSRPPPSVIVQARSAKKHRRDERRRRWHHR